MNHKIVVMGVAGCGKSTLGTELARALGCELIEGDDAGEATAPRMAATLAWLSTTRASQLLAS